MVMVGEDWGEREGDNCVLIFCLGASQVIVLVDSTADATSVRTAAAKIFEMAVGFKTNIVIEVRMDEGGELMASAPAANGSLFQ